MVNNQAKLDNSAVSQTAYTPLVLELLELLRQRPQSVLIKRFGLKGTDVWVLDKIGRELGVTRERIRQIESDSFKKLQKVKKSAEYKELIDKAIEIIKESGGFCERKALKESIKKDVTQRERNQLMFLLNCSSEIKFKKDNLKMSGFWYLPGTKIENKVQPAHDFLFTCIKQAKKVHSLSDVYSAAINDPQWKEFFQGQEGKKRLEMIMWGSRQIGCNIMDEWGVHNWKEISSRGSKEKAHLVLRKYNKPAHFRQITELINKHWPEKRALPQTVHNELIKDERFILVTRGTYGLKDWE